MTPSTASPTISKPLSTSMRSLPLRVLRGSPRPRKMPRRPRSDHQPRQKQAGAEIKPQRAVDVGHGSDRRAVAEERVLDDAVGIMPRSGEREAERPGHRRLGPTGI